MKHNVPNLDAMPPKELMQFWYNHQKGTNYRELFPEGGIGTKRLTAELANYASNKATAMSVRLKGFIDNALAYESICERIYNRLPESVRW